MYEKAKQYNQRVLIMLLFGIMIIISSCNEVQSSSSSSSLPPPPSSISSLSSTSSSLPSASSLLSSSRSNLTFSTYTTHYMQTIYDIRTIKDTNCHIKASSVLSVLVCKEHIYVMNSYYVNNVDMTKFGQYANYKLRLFEIFDDLMVIIYQNNVLDIGIYTDYQFKTQKIDLPGNFLPLKVQVIKGWNSKKLLFLLYDLMHNQQKDKLRLRIIELDDNLDDKEHRLYTDYDLYTPILEKSIASLNVIINNISNETTLFQILIHLYNTNNNNHIYIYQISYSNVHLPLQSSLQHNQTNSTHNSTFIQDIILEEITGIKNVDFFIEKSYIMGITQNKYVRNDDSKVNVSVYKYNLNYTINISNNHIFHLENLCLFDFILTSERYSAYLQVYDTNIVVSINAEKDSILMYDLGNINHPLFAKHIIIHKIRYENNWFVPGWNVYVDELSRIPLLFIEKDGYSSLLILLACAPQHYYYPLYQQCIPCDSGYFSHGLRKSSCTWCNGMLLDIMNKTDNIDKAMDQKFFVAAEYCYIDQGYSNQCVDCIHQTHLVDNQVNHDNNASTLENMKVLDYSLNDIGIPFNTSEFKQICKSECNNLDFLSLIQEGPTADNHMSEKCNQLSNCYDCSSLKGCMWCNNMCKSILDCESNSLTKTKDTLLDYLTFFELCPSLPSCGEQGLFIEDNKTITLKNVSFSKNTVCIWTGSFANGFYNTYVDLNINTNKSLIMNNHINYYMSYCIYEIGFKRCFFYKISPNNILTVVGFTFKIFMVIKEDIPSDGFDMEFSYVKIGHDFYYAIFLITLWTLMLILTCVLIITFIGFCKKLFLKLREWRRFRRMMQPVRLHEENVELSLGRIFRRAQKTQNNRNVKFTPKDNEFEQTECCFCLEPFTQQEKLTKLPCKHLFHIKCWDNWVSSKEQNQIKCPLCIQIIT